MSYQLNDTAYSVLAVGGWMPAARMQALVYETNIVCLQDTGKFLFPEDFQAWPGGPICPELVKIVHGLWYLSIDEFSKRCPKARLLKERYLDMARLAVRRTAWNDYDKPGTPWAVARGNLKRWEDATRANTITKQMLRAYYL